MPVCVRCGTSLETAYKYCDSCGYPVQQQTMVAKSNSVSSSDSRKPVCVQCGKKISASDKFCGKCGYQVKSNNPDTLVNSASCSTSSIQKLICLNCGVEMGVSDKYCGRCGYSACSTTQNSATHNRSNITTNATSAYYLFQPMSEQEKVIAELNKMCEYFSKFQSLYDDYDKYYMVRHNIYKEVEELQKEEPSILDLLFSTRDDKNKRNYNAEIEECNVKMVSISLELTKNYANYGYCIIGPEYTNPKYLTRIRDIMISRRARTLDDAIKTFYHDCRRREIWARDMLEAGINNNNAHGAKTASAFIPSNYFFDKSFRYI